MFLTSLGNDRSNVAIYNEMNIALDLHTYKCITFSTPLGSIESLIHSCVQIHLYHQKGSATGQFRPGFRVCESGKITSEGIQQDQVWKQLGIHSNSLAAFSTPNYPVIWAEQMKLAIINNPNIVNNVVVSSKALQHCYWVRIHILQCSNHQSSWVESSIV